MNLEPHNFFHSSPNFRTGRKQGILLFASEYWIVLNNYFMKSSSLVPLFHKSQKSEWYAETPICKNGSWKFTLKPGFFQARHISHFYLKKFLVIHYFGHSSNVLCEPCHRYSFFVVNFKEFHNFFSGFWSYQLSLHSNSSRSPLSCPINSIFSFQYSLRPFMDGHI